ncbi:hypothetical protein [Rhizobium sp. BR 362]|uniref:hypothetical protein n=1 Tax=Rhizobium sp. BR 362 TaxID=3040670 RepID=UPI002F423CFA
MAGSQRGCAGARGDRIGVFAIEDKRTFSIRLEDFGPGAWQRWIGGSFHQIVEQHVDAGQNAVFARSVRRIGRRDCRRPPVVGGIPVDAGEESIVLRSTEPAGEKFEGFELQRIRTFVFENVGDVGGTTP